MHIAASSLARFCVAFCLLATLARAEQPAPAVSRAPAPAPAPIPPAEAAGRMTLPQGFNATLFAGEPDVVQPIAFCTDDRGRLWVGECLSYPKWDQTGAMTGPDRIVIFEDTTGSGHFDKRTVFADNLANLSGFALGFGGVYVCSTPRLLFIPVKSDEDKPAGPPQVLLDGWNTKDCQHNVVSHLAWGPDGWLYGLNGIQSRSRVGKPGTADEQRTYFDCGVWRYHPTRQTFEVVANGTTNPWGLDWDDFGQGFITNCVINHLWHVIPGAHYERMYNKQPDEINVVYEPMKPCADHFHFVGKWTDVRTGLGANGDTGGGHAHVGAMVYLGDNWPDSYRNTIFMCNIHGNRVNNDLLEQHGSGYVGRHGKDFLLANDAWFRGLDLQAGPDGGVYVSDWTDTGECHNHVVVDRTNGRIYKVTYGKVAPLKLNLATKSDAELVALQLHKNDWFDRHARRLLQERTAAGKLDPGVRPALLKILKENPDVTRKLRALWCLHVTGGVDQAVTDGLLASPEPYVRGWAIQLALEAKQAPAPLLAKLAEMAKSDPSPAVRLFLASGLQRLPLENRWPIAAALVAHSEDATDKDLPLMDWFGCAALATGDDARAAGLISSAKIPVVRQYMARRIATLAEAPAEPAPATNSAGHETADRLAPLMKVLAESDDAELHSDVLRGMNDAFDGRRHLPMPRDWAAVHEKLARSPDAYVKFIAKNLALIFGDPAALAELRRTAADKSADAKLRGSAIESLVQARDPGNAALLNGLTNDPAVRGFAIKGLAEVGDEATPALLLKHYDGYSPDEKRQAINTLASRAAFANALLDAVDANKIPHGDLSAYTVRQLAGLNDTAVTQRVGKIFGAIRPTAADKAADIARLKKQLTPDALGKADLHHGRLVFSRTCAQCHTLFDAGGNVGPNLTGAQRQSLDYLLENIVDPSAIVARDYYMTIVDTRDDRTITGIIKEETDASLILRTPTGDVTILKPEIQKRRTQPISLMPEGLLQGLKGDESADLLGYLQSPVQVDLPPGQPAAGGK